MVNKPYIRLRNVSKIFGENPDSVIELVKNDIDKNELQNNHHHVIGLQNINIDIPKNKIPGLYGALWIWEINVDKTPKSTYKTNNGRDNCK